MSTALEQEFKYYLDHQSELVAKYDGKYIVINNGAVLGVYDDALTAVTETQKDHKLGTFLIQHVTPGEGAYTQTFHSRAVIS